MAKFRNPEPGDLFLLHRQSNWHEQGLTQVRFAGLAVWVALLFYAIGWLPAVTERVAVWLVAAVAAAALLATRGHLFGALVHVVIVAVGPPIAGLAFVAYAVTSLRNWVTG